MRARLAILTVVTAMSAFVLAPAYVHGQQAPADQNHDQHHPEATTPAAQTPAPPASPANMQGMQSNMMGNMNRMKADDAKLDDLVKKMNAATGQAKVDAMAAVLTALVEDRHLAMEPMMSNMMAMMNMMSGGGMMNGMKNK